MSNDNFNRNLRALGMAQAINFLYPLFIFPVVGKGIGATAFGEVMSHYAIAMILATFIDFGFNFEGPRQALSAHKCVAELTRTYVAVTFVKVVICALAMLVASAYFVIMSNKAGLNSELFIITAFPIMLGSALNPQWLLHGLSRLHWLVHLSAAIRAVCLISFLTFAPTSVYGAALAISAPLAITSLVAAPFLPLRGIFNNDSYSVEEMARITRASFAAFLSNISTLPYTQGGMLLLNYMHGPVAAAFYASADRLIRPIIAVHGVIFQAAYPAACDTPEVQGVRRKPLLLAYAVSILAMITIVFFSERLITAVYSIDFLPAATALVVMSIMLITTPLAMSTAHLRLLASGRGKVASRVYGITSGCFCLLAPVIIFQYGYVGAASSIVLAETMATTLLVVASRKISHGRP